MIFEKSYCFGLFGAKDSPYRAAALYLAYFNSLLISISPKIIPK